MIENRVRQRLAAGRAVLGSWLTTASPLVAELMATRGYDWLMIDLEHSPASWETAAAMIGAIIRRGVAPYVRVPSGTAENVKRALDAGAMGVLVPMVNSPEEAAAMVAATRYPPEGQRSIGGWLRSARWDTDAAGYLEAANREVLLIVQAEHVRHLERADAIATVPGVGVVFIGPNDFSASYGRRRGDPAMEEAYAGVLAACKAAGVAPGFHAADAAEAALRLRQGFRFVAVGTDDSLLARAASADLAALAELRGD
ncbi:MAG TPA: aldolase/citrate lyase family protein [Bacillota bacterium]|nr:aldolase/citrate lyase family protein [Bacillota bacterium]